MRKSTAIAAAVCIAASLLFFAAPTFREAFEVSLAQWHSIPGLLKNQGGFYGNRASELDKIEREARAKRDAEGLAFVALNKRGLDDTAQLADEAVGIDPNLSWVYPAIGARYWGHPAVFEWLPKLKSEKPGDALPHLIAAERTAFARDAEGRSRWYSREYVNDPTWQKEMAAAFSASSLGTYDDQVRQLERNVSARYHIDDPYEAQSQYWMSLSFMAGTPNVYADYLMDSAKELTAHGNYQAAIANYQSVIRFAKLWQSSASMLALPMLEQAYRGAASTYEAQGDRNETQFYASLASDAARTINGTRALSQAALKNANVATRNAAVIEFSGFAMLLSGVVLITCVLLAATKCRLISPEGLYVSRGMNMLGAFSIATFMLSTVAMYFTYRPYAEIAHNYLLNGDESRIRDLSLFLNRASTPPGAGRFYQVWSIPTYFWITTIVLCAVALLLVTAKFLRQKRSAILA